MTPALDPVRLDALRKLVDVKPLEWDDDVNASTPFGTYTVRDAEFGVDGYQWTFHSYPFGVADEKVHPRIGQAIEAAQADYESRIRSAIADTTLALLAERPGFLARIAELEAESAQFQEAAGQQMVRAEGLEDQLDRGERERGELRAALEPLAKAADRADHNAELFGMTTAASEEMSPGLGIKFSHLRAARAAILPKASVREERG